MSAQGAEDQQEPTTEEGQGPDQEQESSEEVEAQQDVPAEEKLEKLMKENAKYRQRLRELKPLAEKWTEKVNSEKSEAQLLKEQYEKLQQDYNKTIKERIAADAGMPKDFIPLLQGNEEEMTATAKVLAEKYGGKTPPSTNRPTPVLRSGNAVVDEARSFDDVLRSMGR